MMITKLLLFRAKGLRSIFAQPEQYNCNNLNKALVATKMLLQLSKKVSPEKNHKRKSLNESQQIYVAIITHSRVGVYGEIFSNSLKSEKQFATFTSLQIYNNNFRLFDLSLSTKLLKIPFYSCKSL